MLSGGGFVLAINYSDQMTGSIENLRNLQCFVGKYIDNVRVVEPFVIESMLGVSLSPSYSQWRYNIPLENLNKVRLRDIVDINQWENNTRLNGFASLVTWNCFMKKSPKKLLLVYHTWKTKKVEDWRQFLSTVTKEFVVENDFKIVRRVRINFVQTGELSPQEFLNTVYGPLNPNEVVVVLNTWGGISPHVEKFRYAINDSFCSRNGSIMLNHSKQLLNDVDEYATKYLDKRYIAVMVRLEQYSYKFTNMIEQPLDYQHKTLKKCFDEIIQKVEWLKKWKNISVSLLTMDIGKYGALCFQPGRHHVFDAVVVNETVHNFFKSLFGETWTQDAWEESFTDVAHFDIPGYVAMMQQELAANSDYLVLAGGGSFQSNAQALYKKRHPDSKFFYHVCLNHDIVKLSYVVRNGTTKKRITLP